MKTKEERELNLVNFTNDELMTLSLSHSKTYCKEIPNINSSEQLKLRNTKYQLVTNIAFDSVKPISKIVMK